MAWHWISSFAEERSLTSGSRNPVSIILFSFWGWMLMFLTHATAANVNCINDFEFGDCWPDVNGGVADSKVSKRGSPCSFFPISN